MVAQFQFLHCFVYIRIVLLLFILILTEALATAPFPSATTDPHARAQHRYHLHGHHHNLFDEGGQKNLAQRSHLDKHSKRQHFIAGKVIRLHFHILAMCKPGHKNFSYGVGNIWSSSIQSSGLLFCKSAPWTGTSLNVGFKRTPCHPPPIVAPVCN